MPNEADMCRLYVVLKLQAVGWEDEPYSINEQLRPERAERVRKEKKDFFDQYGPEARAVLNDLLDKYTEHGAAQFVLPDVLEVPPISQRGNVVEIADQFGGAEKLLEAVGRLQELLYAA